jgi:molybdenum cofactor synthesis domain-containing protein
MSVPTPPRADAADGRASPLQIAVLTISDGVARGEREDRSGALLGDLLAPLGEVIARDVVPDEGASVEAALRRFCDQGVDLVVTTGGTGLGPRDITPEATRAVIEREVPGIAEAMRAATLAKTPMAMLSRAVCGVRGRTLILNLPGSPKGVRECLEVALPVLKHAAHILAGGGH